MSRRGVPTLQDAGLPLAQYTTKCGHCPQIFRSSGIPIIGTSAQQAAAAFLNNLVQHLMQKHPEVAQACYIEQAKYGGIVFMQQFATDDPELLKQRDQTRHDVHKFTQKVHISDATIEQRVRQLPAVVEGVPNAADVIALMKEFRDVLEETLQPQTPITSNPDTPQPS
jgi:hypothetical protein